jgi:hypothetical protein
MNSEPKKIHKLFKKLLDEPKHLFLAKGQKLIAPKRQGVYIIRKKKVVFHVGRTTRAQRGLHQRLTAHLHGRSSFVRACFNRNGDRLRLRFSYQILIVSNPRHRALLEAYAAGKLCPKHFGTGEIEDHT